MLINIRTLLIGTAIIVFNGPLVVGLRSTCKNWAWRSKHGEREIQAGEVANVLIGIGAIFIAITRMMKGLVINF